MQRFNNETAQNFMQDPAFRRLAQLPLLTLFYLYFQRQIVSTPVTPLELAAYLGTDVRAIEGVLSFPEGVGILRRFKQDLPAYCLHKDLSEISVLELLPVLAKFQELIPAEGASVAPAGTAEADDRYRRVYSELASELLQLAQQAPVNQLPI